MGASAAPAATIHLLSSSVRSATSTSPGRAPCRCLRSAAMRSSSGIQSSVRCWAPTASTTRVVGFAMHAADVGLGVLGEQPLRAGLPVPGDQRGLVAAHRGDPVERAGIAREADRAGGEVVLVLDHHDRLEIGAGDAIDDVAALLVARLDGELRAQLAVQHDPGQLLAVLEQQLALAGADVDAVDVVPGLVAVVEADRQHVRLIEAQLLDAGVDARQRREVARRPPSTGTA